MQRLACSCYASARHLFKLPLIQYAYLLLCLIFLYLVLTLYRKCDDFTWLVLSLGFATTHWLILKDALD